MSEEILLIVAANIPLTAETYRLKIYLNALNRRFRENTWQPPKELRHQSNSHTVMASGGDAKRKVIEVTRRYVYARNFSKPNEQLIRFVAKDCPFLDGIVYKDRRNKYRTISSTEESPFWERFLPSDFNDEPESSNGDTYTALDYM